MGNLPKQVIEQDRLADEAIAKAKGQTPNEGTLDQGAGTKKPDSIDWEHKYSVLDGKYRQEVPRLQAENRSLAEKLNVLSTQVEELTTKNGNESLFSEEFANEYGSELVEGITDATNKAIDGKTKKLEDEVLSMRKDAHKKKVDFYWSQVDAAIPNFNEINDSPDFMHWLGDTRDDISGNSMRAILEHANGVLDSQTVVAVFKRYIAHTKKTPKLSDRAEFIPDSQAAVDTQAGQIKGFKESEVSAFYKACAEKRISDDDAVKIEAQIEAAGRAGLITKG